MALNRDQILGAATPHVEVDVPELGGTVRVRQMSAREMFEFSRRGESDQEATGAWLVATCVIGEDGQRLFTEADIPALQEKSFRAVERIAAAVFKANRLGAEDQEQAAKN